LKGPAGAGLYPGVHLASNGLRIAVTVPAKGHAHSPGYSRCIKEVRRAFTIAVPSSLHQSDIRPVEFLAEAFLEVYNRLFLLRPSYCRV